MSRESRNELEQNGVTKRVAEQPLMSTNRTTLRQEFEHEIDYEQQYRCGYGSCTPSCLQYLHNAKCLVVCLSLIGVCLGMVVNGLVPVSITTLERRFELSSTDSGIFAGAYKLASMMAMLPVAYYSGKGHKGRYLGFGAFSLGLGSLVCVLPQLLSPPYQYGSYRASNITDSGSHVSSVDHLCLQNRTHDISAQRHEVQGMSRTYFYLLVLGQLLHGCGGAPIVLLAVTFIDDNVSQMASPIYSSIFMACRNIIGPAIGYIFGGMSLKIYGDFLVVDRKNIKLRGPDDMRWYGAWWIGFAIVAVVSAVLAVPIFGFARRLPEAARHRAKDVNQAHESSTKSVYSIMALLKNPTFLGTVLTQGTEAFMVSGLVTFTPKIIESVFGHSASSSSLESGAILLTGGLSGTLLGGFLVRRLRLRCKGMIRLAMLTSCICLPLYFLFTLRCSQLPFAGQSVPYYNYEREQRFIYQSFSNTSNVPWVASTSLTESCNNNCHCTGYFQPICDINTETTYYSPCHAACTAFSENGFTNCSCAPPQTTLMAGRCPIDCNLFVLFCVLYSAFAMITFTATIPLQQATLRSVQTSQRTIAMGWFLLVDGLATLLGAVSFGVAIDSLCVLWKVTDTTDGVTQKNCVRYDADNIGLMVLAFGAAAKIAGFLMLTVAQKYYRIAASGGDVNNPVHNNRNIDSSIGETFEPENVSLTNENNVDTK